ncbi:MAG TPA: hypothetical protein DD727_07150 [Clostridiales bacterium]|nr:hypothetical protein [Clostridiales bacterium]
MASMSKRDQKWFEMFISMGTVAADAGEALSNLIENYEDPEDKLAVIKDLEHKGDKIVHQMYDELGKAFMTPIDREYIAKIISSMDDIIDRIYLTARMFDVYAITEMTPYAVQLSGIMTRCLASLKQASIEFMNYRKNEKLARLIIEVNCIEEEGDYLHKTALKDLFNADHSAVNIIKWKDIYETMEGIMDSCEDVADLMENIIMALD